MVEQRKRQIRFRINCEQVPVLPAWLVHWVWEDPRQIPYLLVWNIGRDGQVKEAIRVARFVSEITLQEVDAVEARSRDGSTVAIYLVWRRQPNGGSSML